MGKSMKTLNEFYKEMLANEELKKEYAALKTDDEAAKFLKAHDVDATVPDLKALIAKGEMHDDDLAKVAGGTSDTNGNDDSTENGPRDVYPGPRGPKIEIL